MLKKLPITALTLTLLFTALFTIIGGASGADIPLESNPAYVFNVLFRGPVDPAMEPPENIADGIPYEHFALLDNGRNNYYSMISSSCQELIFKVSSYSYDGSRLQCAGYFVAKDGSPVVVANGSRQGNGAGQSSISWGYFRETNNIFRWDSLNSQYSYHFLTNGFIITTEDGELLDEPIVADTFNADFGLGINKQIMVDAYTNTVDKFDVEIRVCPNTDGYPVQFRADDLYTAQTRYLLAPPAEKDSALAKFLDIIAELSGKPAVFEYIMNLPDYKAQEIYEQSKVTEEVIDPEQVYLRVQQLRKIRLSSYVWTSGKAARADHFNYTLSVPDFYEVARAASNYQDNCVIYVIFYDRSINTPDNYNVPLAIFGQAFRVSDFFPDGSVDIPPPIMPDPDDTPKYPEGSDEDWTIYQHAMYMRKLLENLKIILEYPSLDMVAGSSWDVSAEYDYTYKPIDYETDVELTDYAFTAIDPADPTISSTFTLFPKLLTKSVEATGLTKLLALMLSVSVIAWFIYGRK